MHASPDSRKSPTWTPVDAALAVTLGWLIPGAGHLYLGRRRKALALFVLILGTYMAGQAITGFQCVFYRRSPMLKAQLWFYGQAGAGLPTALFTLLTEPKAETDQRIERITDDGRVETVVVPGEARLRFELRPYFEIGTLWTTVAGLFNLLAVVDVYNLYYRSRHPADREKEHR